MARRNVKFGGESGLTAGLSACLAGSGMLYRRRTAMFKISATDLQTCQDIMRRVHDERPGYWPYGLSAAHFDGGLWMIRKQASGEPAGFVGWQERREGGRRVGYYSVGLLPGYRGNGMAKTAVNRLLAEKAAGVDVIKAFVCDGNKPSIGLAKSLSKVHNIDMELFKQAGIGSFLGKILKHTAFPVSAGYGNAVFWDQALHPEVKLTDSLQFKGMDKQRSMMAILNGLIGATGGAAMQQGGRMIAQGAKPIDPAAVKELGAEGAKRLGEDATRHLVGGTAAAAGGFGSMLMTPAKDVLMQTLPVMRQTGGLIKDIQSRANRPPSPLTNLDPKVLLALGGAGLLGLGGLTYAGLRSSKAMKDMAAKSSKGTVRVTLPTKNPGDAETQVEVPIEDMQLSETIYNALGRDTRRRLRGENAERKQKFLTEQQRAKNLGINMDDNAQIIAQPPQQL